MTIYHNKEWDRDGAPSIGSINDQSMNAIYSELYLIFNWILFMWWDTFTQYLIRNTYMLIKKALFCMCVYVCVSVFHDIFKYHWFKTQLIFLFFPHFWYLLVTRVVKFVRCTSTRWIIQDGVLCIIYSFFL